MNDSGIGEPTNNLSSKHFQLEEWKVSMENARHFNDLLMRLRMLGLPGVVTLSLAAIASNQFFNLNKVEIWLWSVPIFFIIVTIIAWVLILNHTIDRLRVFHNNKFAKKNMDAEQEPPLPIYWLELTIWLILMLSPTVYSVIKIYNFANQLVAKGADVFIGNSTYSFMPMALIAAVMLLLVLYAIDRFYYYKLLLGAICRLVVLEKDLNFSITEVTSKFIPRDQATIVVTIFYCIPAIILLLISCISL